MHSSMNSLPLRRGFSSIEVATVLIMVNNSIISSTYCYCGEWVGVFKKESGFSGLESPFPGLGSPAFPDLSPGFSDLTNWSPGFPDLGGNSRLALILIQFKLKLFASLNGFLNV
jgi:hypothetical protein